MLTKFIGKVIKLRCTPRFTFSSSHDSHQTEVLINKEKPWIRYKSDPKFVGIEGVEDTNYPLQPPLDDDPFAHLRNEPYFSFNRFIFNDPWFHEDSHQPYNSQPDRGYINGSDPLDGRHVLSTPQYLSFTILVAVGLLYSFADPLLMNAEAGLARQKQARNYTDKCLAEKNKELNELRAIEAELLRKTSK